MINLNNKSFLKFFLFFLISGILIFFDQLTKFFAVKYIKTDLLTISFKPFFEFLYVENTGAAFGIFKGMRVFFILITIVAIIVFALIELSLFTDVTLGSKEDTRIPTIQQVKASGYKKYTKDGVTSYRKE